MTKHDLPRLAEDLEAGRLDAESAQKLAAKALPKNPWLQQASQLVAEAQRDYADGRTGRAWAAATIADAYLRTWTRTRLQRWALPAGGDAALDSGCSHLHRGGRRPRAVGGGASPQIGPSAGRDAGLDARASCR